jgi:Co/Zn/Cd efflux system component
VKVETHSEDIAHFCGVQLTNRRLLWVSAITFFLFVVAELLGAIISNSLSLLGDAAAMSVDVFSVSSWLLSSFGFYIFLCAPLCAVFL